MERLADGQSYFDLNFRGRSRAIACGVMAGRDGVALVDPGPSSTLPTLRRALDTAGIRMSDLTALLLTHIHLDHAGATGTLVREHPHLRVFVHERGAPHMAEPSRLIASAARLYGDAMDDLWGEFAPVPRDAMTVLRGGERIEAGGSALEVAYTPGHASHHVSYFSARSGVAFVGDTAGIRIVHDGFVLPPTPPPDIDLELWQASLGTIARWQPETLFLTHFGPSSPAGPHLSELAETLSWAGELWKASLQVEGDDRDREAWYADQFREAIRRRVGEADALAYEISGRFDLNWRGLARYWQKKST